MINIQKLIDEAVDKSDKRWLDESIDEIVKGLIEFAGKIR